MSDLLGKTVEDLISTMKDRRVRIPSEIGAYLALEVCEALLAGPAVVRPKDVRVAEDGAVSVFAPPGSATTEESARSVVSLLGSLLVAAGTGVPQVLVRLLEDGPSGGRWDLASLRDDLEASLVPLNRSAAQRVLARMLRDVRRPLSERPRRAPSEQPVPGDPTLDDQLDDLLAIDAMPPRRESARPSVPPSLLEPEVSGAEATLADYDGSIAAGHDAPVSAEDQTLAEDPPSFDRSPEPEPRPQPQSDGRSDESTGVDLDALADELVPKRGSALPWILAFVVVLLATGIAFAVLRPDLVDRWLGRPPTPEAPAGPTEEERAQALRDHRAQFGTLVITADPPGSQVLLFVGRGPAEAPELPVGVAHEFVAIADGHAPSRAFIPADGTWEERDDTPRYELALQVSQDEMSEADLALGPTTLERDALGSSTGALGVARIITTPPGARVYLLVGFSPSVRVENVRTAELIELLVYHEGYPVHTELVRPSAWIEGDDGVRRAELRVTLEGYEPE